MGGWFRRMMIVCAKETKDNARDRRSLLVALIYPLIGPILLGVMMSLVASALGKDGGEAKAPKTAPA